MLKRSSHALAILLVGSGLSVATAKQADSTGSDLARRRERALGNIAQRTIDWSKENDVKLAHFVAQARFANEQNREAQAIIRRMLAHQEMVDYYDPEFPLWSIMDCYMRWKDVPGKYTSELRRQTRDYIAAAQGPSSPTTYNHHWMLAVGLMLAHQQWGPEVVRYRYSDEDPTGRKWVEKQFDRIVRRSFPEMLTDTYSRFNMGAILSLYNFHQDPSIRARARMVLDWILLQQAAYFFKGHSAGATRRTYFPLQQPDNYLSPNWLYFGGPIESGGELAVANAGFALSQYQPPSLFREIAWDRSKTYVQLGSRCPALAERLVTYFDRSYVMFSQYEVKNDLGRRSTWHHEFLKAGVRWDSAPDEYSTLFIKHPCPKEPAEIGLPWLGDTEFHQVLQHRGTMVGVCNIPAERPPEYLEESWRNCLLGVLPGNQRAMIDESLFGELFLHYGTVMVAIHTTEPIHLQPSSWPVMLGKAKEFRIEGNDDGLQAGYAIMTARPTPEIGNPAEQLARFREQVRPRFDALEFFTSNQTARIQCRDRQDNVLELEYRPKGVSSVRRINGQEIPDIENDALWPLIRNPWIEQEVGGDRLHVRYEGTHLIYDFSRWQRVLVSE